MEFNQFREGNRSGEYRASENAIESFGAEAGEQVDPHNPRKQRKNPAAAGSGETFRGGKWRRESPPLFDFRRELSCSVIMLSPCL